MPFAALGGVAVPGGFESATSIEGSIGSDISRWTVRQCDNTLPCPQQQPVRGMSPAQADDKRTGPPHHSTWK